MGLPCLSAHQWFLAALASVMVGMSKGGFVGIGILSVLLMAEVMPARESTGAILPLLICADFLAVAFYRQHAHWPSIWRVLPPALVGIVAGYFLMQSVPDFIFRSVIGWLVLALVALQAARRWFRDSFAHLPHTRGFGWLMGIWAGVNTMFANAAGPVATLYLLAMNMQKLEFVGTIAWMFLIINLVKVPFSAHLGLINPSSLTLNAILLPGVLVGILTARFLITMVSQKTFETFLLSTAALASIRLIFS